MAIIFMLDANNAAFSILGQNLQVSFSSDSVYYLTFIDTGSSERLKLLLAVTAILHFFTSQ